MPTDTPRFIHLRCHSEHSLLEGAIPVKKLAGLAAKKGMPAVALTDRNGLYAAMAFSDACKDAGVQPIVALRQILFGTLEPIPRGSARSTAERWGYGILNIEAAVAALFSWSESSWSKMPGRIDRIASITVFSTSGYHCVTKPSTA